MSGEELAAFIDEQRVVVVATIGPRGWPHLMPLWYVVRDGELWAWTYGKSQKAKNLERDPRATLQLESGERYDELRGVMIEAETVIHRDTEQVAALGAEIYHRYTGHSNVDEMIRAQAPKRIALQFVPRHTTSWDHRKLGGAY
jgi:PPOX class probable F420-dependent enzyme